MRIVIKMSRIINTSYVLVPHSATEHLLAQISKWGGRRLIPAVSPGRGGQGPDCRVMGRVGQSQTDECGAGGPNARWSC